MARVIKCGSDLAWLLTHTGTFHGGHITDLSLHKQRLLDEKTGRDIPAGTTMIMVIQYEPPLAGVDSSLRRVARLTLKGVSDFSVFEQEGTDFSEIVALQAEASEGRLRFWFDPNGELYVVCEEAELEEVTSPGIPSSTGEVAEWTFQAQDAALPDIHWFLDQLDRVGVPSVWKPRSTQAGRWSGRLVPSSSAGLPAMGGIDLDAYSLLEGGFGIRLRAADHGSPRPTQLLSLLAEIITRSFQGLCLVQNQIVSHDDWRWTSRHES